MKEYLFLEGEPDAGYQEVFERTLFHERAQLSLQAENGWVNFYIVTPSFKKILAFFPIHVQGQLAQSPYRSPFGSIAFSNTLPLSVLYNFIEFVEDKLKEQGVKQLLIKNPPMAYNPHQISLLQVMLQNNGFVARDAEIGAVITVDSKPFEEKINQTQFQKLQLCRADGLRLQRVNDSSWELVYDFIFKWYSAKNRSLSLSKDEMRKVVVAFPDRFLFTTVIKDKTIVAAAISISVTKHVLYNFYLAHDSAYSNYSPVVMLLEGLYNYCKAGAINLFDLGTSAIAGKPNFALLNFKKRVGAAFTSKNSFVKNL